MKLTAIIDSNDYHKIETRADFEVIDELPEVGGRFMGKIVSEIREVFAEYICKDEFAFCKLYEMEVVDDSEGYKRYVVVGYNLEPLPRYSFDTIEEAKEQIIKFEVSDKEEFGEVDYYWVSDYSELVRVAVA